MISMLRDHDQVASDKSVHDQCGKPPLQPRRSYWLDISRQTLQLFAKHVQHFLIEYISDIEGDGVAKPLAQVVVHCSKVMEDWQCMRGCVYISIIIEIKFLNSIFKLHKSPLI